MAALTFRPVRPMAVQELLGDVSLYFVLFFFVVAQFIAGIVLAIRVDGGGERDRLAIRGPYGRRIVAALRHLDRRTAFGGREPDVAGIAVGVHVGCGLCVG